ncbi:hypothetical protein HN011_000195 [Eciton burchellii]|nr:hypothetical protein HN011_000195 [Eciton burchellii]
MSRETIPLYLKDANSGLSLLFATLCIIDIFGVFPIITLPRTIIQCGFYGIPLVFIVFSLQIYTAILLGKSWIIANILDPQISQKNRYPLVAVTELTMGLRAGFLISILMDLIVFGCGIPNLLIASQNLYLFGSRLSKEHFDLSFHYWLLIIGALLCPLTWLGSPRDMKWIVTCSSIIVTLTTILIWWSIIIDDRMFEAASIITSPTWDKFISGCAMLAFQFDVHPTLQMIQIDMRHPQNINKAIIFSFITNGSFFVVTICLAVWKYGNNTTANILEIVPSGSITNIAILLTALQLCFSSVIGYSALFQHLEDRWNIDSAFGWKRCVLRSAIVLLSVAVGESVPRFDIIMTLIGGSLTGLFIFLLPPIVYSRVLTIKRSAQTTMIAESFRPNSCKRFSSEEQRSMSSGVHSYSACHDFLNTANNSHSYIFLRFDDLDGEINSRSSESNEWYENEDKKKTSAHQENQPLLVVTKSSRSQTLTSDEMTQNEITVERKKLWDSERLIDYFGYLIIAIVTDMNIFRLLGDLSHLLAIIILLLKIWKTRSCAGISGKSQILFAIVYTSRYLDLFTTFISAYNTFMKIIFIATSLATVFLMYVKFKATYDHNHDTFRIEFLVLPAFVLALLINHELSFVEVLWTFSIYLESVAILPQLFLVSKTGEAESITSHYLFALGSYRGLYLFNWVYRYYAEDHYDLIAIVAGLVQTVLYCDFFYLYITKVLKGKKLQLPA